MKQKGDLPVISVTQKPIDFGQNICVGDVGLSYVNEWRQILLGAREAKTEYLVFCESDFLYPKEYFEFEPKDEGIYRYDNVWIIFDKFGMARRKKSSEGAQICRRDFIIDRLERGLKDMPKWYDGKEVPWSSNKQKYDMLLMPHKMFSGIVPCVSFKSGRGVRTVTNVMNGKENRANTLPYWGKVTQLKKDYLCI